MDNKKFKIRLKPSQAHELLRKKLSYELLYEITKSIDETRESVVSVYEVFFFRNSSRAGLTVTIDNIDGLTEVNVVPAGTSQGMVFSLDWGAGSDMCNKVRSILSEYICE